ncbi:MAG: hypothetical protein H6722_29185 [Sandaracinus sp.]|nr:hypothetical protein [Sandaracinus sp.]MCB9623901.1 hypothetical protein [Sandaracinus sp.]
MGRFFAGFALASFLWGGVVVALYQGWIALPIEEPELVADAPPEVEEVEEDDAPSAMRRRRARRRRSGAGGDETRSGGRTPTGEATTGDDLGENDPRGLNLEGNGGEEQLRHAEIEEGIDRVFPRIRRCLVLVEGDGDPTGRLIVKMRIAGSGRVTRVQLRGPAAVTTGEPGGCIQTAVRSMQLRSFDGPDMFVDYPIDLS